MPHFAGTMRTWCFSQSTTATGVSQSNGTACLKRILRSLKERASRSWLDWWGKTQTFCSTWLRWSLQLTWFRTE